jgi:hypothetical protein
MAARGNAQQRFDIGLLSAELLTTSPVCTIQVSSFRTARIFIEFLYGAATSVEMAVKAVINGITKEYIDLTATYSHAVSADENFYWDIPVNCSEIELTFTGGGTPTTDKVTVHAAVID